MAVAYTQMMTVEVEFGVPAMMRAWLESNVGAGNYRIHWIPNSMQGACQRVKVFLRDEDVVLFKLTWG